MKTPTTTSHPRRARAWRVRLAAAAGALALLFSGMVGATAAMADTRTGLPDPTVGSLTIHKLEGAETGDVNDGKEITGIEGTPLNGVEFTVTQVTGTSGSAGNLSFDLTTSEGWENMRKARVQNNIDSIVNGLEDPNSEYTYGYTESIVTGAAGTDGIALFEELPLGLYIVMETGNTNNVFSSTDPFLVTIPLNIAGADGKATGDLLYDVHVYPKNSLVKKPVKTVSEPTSNYSTDGELTWTVSQAVPRLLEGDLLSQFEIVDEIGEGLSFISGSYSVEVEGLTLVNDEDYYITITDDNKLTVEFSAAGRSKLVAGDQGRTVKVSFKTTVSANGEYVNNAHSNINYFEYKADPVTVRWGGLRIIKIDAELPRDVNMNGAVFHLYDEDPTDNSGIDPIATGETKNGGVLEFQYLWIGQGNVTERDYWIVESKAPDGYVVNYTPRKVTVRVNEITEGHFTEVEVLNYKTFIPGLPLTGAQGTAIIIAVGITFLVAAAGLLILRNRRSHSV